MAKNRLTDLNDHLFAQMERLSEEDLDGNDLDREIQRTRAIGQVANNIINNARLAFEAQKAIGDSVRKLPSMLRDVNNGDEK